MVDKGKGGGGGEGGGVGVGYSLPPTNIAKYLIFCEL